MPRKTSPRSPDDYKPYIIGRCLRHGRNENYPETRQTGRPDHPWRTPAVISNRVTDRSKRTRTAGFARVETSRSRTNVRRKRRTIISRNCDNNTGETIDTATKRDRRSLAIEQREVERGERVALKRTDENRGNDVKSGDYTGRVIIFALNEKRSFTGEINDEPEKCRRI